MSRRLPHLQQLHRQQYNKKLLGGHSRVKRKELPITSLQYDKDEKREKGI